MKDPFIREPVSAEFLAKERLVAIKYGREHLDVSVSKSFVFTCDSCSFAPKCTLAFDFYNTDGDCLYSK